MDWASIAHLTHAAAVLLIVGYCAGKRYRDRVRLRSNRYLVHWMLACGVWFLYYLAKAFGLAGTHGQVWTSDAIGLRDLPLLYDVGANLVNSAFIFVAGLVLTSRGKGETIITGLISSGLAVSVTLSGAVFLSLIFWMFDLPRGAWILINSVASSALAAMVLILFYNRLVRSLRRNAALPVPQRDRLAVYSLWAFAGYAYLQAWYPYFFYEGHNKFIEWTVYAAACLLKVLCTFFVFSASFTRDPAESDQT